MTAFSSRLAHILDPQNARIMRLSFPGEDGPDAELLVQHLSATEGLSRDFEFALELISDNARLALKDLLSKRVTVSLVRQDGSLRYFNGHVFEFSLERVDGARAYYRMILRPWLAYLALRHNNLLFHGKSVREQTEAILADYPDALWRIQLEGDDPPMTDACQYGESDHNYLHRRWEALGWTYWYEHTATEHTLCLSDNSTAHAPPVATGEHIAWQAEGGSLEDDGISRLSPIRTLAPARYAVRSFDFKQAARPGASELASINQQGDVPALEVYEYAGAYGFRNAADGDRLSALRMEQIETQAKHFEALSNHRGIEAGRHFTLTGHFDIGSDAGDAEDARLLVVEVTHEVRNNYALIDESGAGAHYANRFRCIRKSIVWRPARGHNSTEPKIYGLQTAVVVGPAGEEIHTDEFGRVRVQFHWDRLGTYDDKSSAWVRVASTWAGERFGFMAIPRIGQEVLVQFLDGNPDRPLITGRVFNSDNMPPWPLPASKTQTGMLSRSSQGGGYDNANAIRFEDKKGEEELWLHAEKNQRIEVENDESHWVGHDRSKTIDNDETVHVKHDRTETVDNNETITVHNNRSERVDHNETISIGDNRSEDVGKNETISIGTSRTKRVGKNERDSIGRSWSINVGKFKTESIGMAYMQNVGLGRMENVGAAYNLNVGGLMATVVGAQRSDATAMNHSVGVGKSFTLKAGEVIELRCGQSVLRMDASGKVTISGSEFLFEASGPVQINGKDIDLN